jgi:hypothetical protein
VKKDDATKDKKAKDDAAEQKGQAAVEAWIDRELKSNVAADEVAVRLPRKVKAVDHEGVRKAFPDLRFYSVHLKPMPRPDMLPEALRTVKLVHVRPDGSVEQVKDVEALKELVAAKLSGVQDEAQARAALLTCLRLAEEYYQDGSVTFAVPNDAVSVSRKGDQIVATGKAVATDGGKGEVRASLSFGPSGILKADDVKISGRVLSDNLLK